MLSVTLLTVTATVSVFTSSACRDGTTAPKALLTQGEAVTIAQDHARLAGLLQAQTPFSTSSVGLPVAQARQLLTSDGRPDPFASVTAPPSEDQLVWVISFVESLTQPTAGSDLETVTEGVAVLVDDASGRVLWAEKSQGVLQ